MKAVSGLCDMNLNRMKRLDFLSHKAGSSWEISTSPEPSYVDLSTRVSECQSNTKIYIYKPQTSSELINICNTYCKVREVCISKKCIYSIFSQFGIHNPSHLRPQSPHVLAKSRDSKKQHNSTHNVSTLQISNLKALSFLSSLLFILLLFAALKFLRRMF